MNITRCKNRRSFLLFNDEELLYAYKLHYPL